MFEFYKLYYNFVKVLFIGHKFDFLRKFGTLLDNFAIHIYVIFKVTYYFVFKESMFRQH